jgi:uncharacterized protein (DUF983 family)
MSASTVQAANGEPNKRDVGLSILRGLQCRCPHCGKGRLFRAYLTTNDYCPVCGQALYHHRADDAPPYFVILIVGHIVVAGILATEVTWQPPSWVEFVIWLPLTIALTIWLLPRVKGAIIGLQWAQRMHGFASVAPDDH